MVSDLWNVYHTRDMVVDDVYVFFKNQEVLFRLDL